MFALDRIYWDSDLEGPAVRAHRTRLARVASDHLPVVALLGVRAFREPIVREPARKPEK
jgi:endonuclease/exonuclease/phosphatase family metal-dependent hydrolase